MHLRRTISTLQWSLAPATEANAMKSSTRRRPFRKTLPSGLRKFCCCSALVIAGCGADMGDLDEQAHTGTGVNAAPISKGILITDLAAVRSTVGIFEKRGKESFGCTGAVI